MSVSSSEFVVLRVRDGELTEAGNWVYAWIDQTGLVVYVGATALDPHTRVWLHLNDADPEWAVWRLASGDWRAQSSTCSR